MRILVIDDDPVSRQIVASGLKKASYRVAAVDCAQAALKELETGAPVALVITDVMLPDMTGLDFLALLRSTPEYSELPVIVCTASETPAFRQLAETFEACAFFPKPIQMKELKRAVKETLAQGEPCISNLRVACERMDMSQDEVIAMVEEVQKQLADLLARAEAAPTTQNPKPLRDACGALRGAAESVGAARVAHTLKKIDETRDDIHPEVLRALLPELRRENLVLAEAIDALKLLPESDATIPEVRIAALCVSDGTEDSAASDSATAPAETPAPDQASDAEAAAEATSPNTAESAPEAAQEAAANEGQPATAATE